MNIDIIEAKLEMIEEELEECCDDCNCHDEEVPEEINDLIDGVIDEIDNGKCLKCALLELYEIALKDGVNSLALGLSDMLSNIVEEE